MNKNILMGVVMHKPDPFKWINGDWIVTWDRWGGKYRIYYKNNLFAVKYRFSECENYLK